MGANTSITTPVYVPKSDAELTELVKNPTEENMKIVKSLSLTDMSRYNQMKEAEAGKEVVSDIANDNIVGAALATGRTSAKGLVDGLTNFVMESPDKAMTLAGKVMDFGNNALSMLTGRRTSVRRSRGFGKKVKKGQKGKRRSYK